MVKLFYTTYIGVDLAHHKIFLAKVGKGGIININLSYSVEFYIKLLITIKKIIYELSNRI